MKAKKALKRLNNRRRALSLRSPSARACSRPVERAVKDFVFDPLRGSHHMIEASSSNSGGPHKDFTDDIHLGSGAGRRRRSGPKIDGR
jgi:hypothetical protein